MRTVCRRGLPPGVCPILILLVLTSEAFAADWPMYRSDAARSGYNSDSMAPRLQLAWRIESVHAPRPAWGTRPRLEYDRAYQPVVADGLLFFGSSVDDSVVAHDARTGTLKWRRHTDGPVRFAPAYHDGRLYVSSDDGKLYALDARTGSELWSHRAAPSADRIVGNGRVISRWPVRGGAVVVGGKVFCGSGIWPSEGVYITALDAASGRKVWLNDKGGTLQTWERTFGQGGIAAHGYLAAGNGSLVVPTGRAVPAVFSLSTGEFRYHHRDKVAGSTRVGVIDGALVNANTRDSVVYSLADGKRAGSVGLFWAAHPRMVITTDGRNNTVLNGWPRSKEGPGVLSTARGSEVWKASTPHAVAGDLIVAGDTVVIGGDGMVSTIGMDSRAAGWTGQIEGTAFGLAASGGRLYVSTDQGHLYCFGPERTAPRRVTAQRASRSLGSHAAAAKEIIEKTGRDRGLCIDLECGKGQLSLALVEQTDLIVYAIDSDEDDVAAARDLLTRAGVYGSRATVHHLKPEQLAGFERYADLVVSGASLTRGPAGVPQKIMKSLLCPSIGAACVGQPGRMRLTRAPDLAGAGNWTHLYADAANTLCSNDEVVRGPLEMRWFLDVPIELPSRHGRAQPPVVHGGLMAMAGLDAVKGMNAYNGMPRWEYEVEGLLRAYNAGCYPGGGATTGVMCTDGKRLFVRVEGECRALDLSTGELVSTLRTPDGSPWGHLAFDDGRVFGTTADDKHNITPYKRDYPVNRLLTQSRTLFACDADSGKLRWTYKADGHIHHPAIAVGGGSVYLIDRPLPAGTKFSKKKVDHDPGRLIAIDATNGRIRWQSERDCMGTMVILSEQYGLVLVGKQGLYPFNYDTGMNLQAFRAADGRMMWKGPSCARPIINDKRILHWSITDLLTGRGTGQSYRRTGKCCGISTGSRWMVAFRSGEVGYVDLARPAETLHYQGVRSGCWANPVFAGGMMIMSDSAYGCRCSYLLQASFALQTRRVRRD